MKLKLHIEVWHPSHEKPLTYSEKFETFGKLVTHLVEVFETRYPTANKIHICLEKKKT